MIAGHKMYLMLSVATLQHHGRLDAGGLLSHAFELESKMEGMFYGAPAVITFHIPTTAALQEAYSTPILPSDILAVRPPEKKFEWAKRLLAKYGSQISVISIVYLVASPSKSVLGKEARRRVNHSSWKTQTIG
ncbi:hypothetical protein CK203_089998 [Vitis vinifera]|uniref:Uncharacterized protein n=1 Tax=Vitis vinifera TaxID=29760 RepID=A0A438BSI0_VITVI|nr:hypothetical protein CK203_089998 [Vitis vinifera]